MAIKLPTASAKKPKEPVVIVTNPPPMIEAIRVHALATVRMDTTVPRMFKANFVGEFKYTRLAERRSYALGFSLRSPSCVVSTTMEISDEDLDDKPKCIIKATHVGYSLLAQLRIEYKKTEPSAMTNGRKATVVDYDGVFVLDELAPSSPTKKFCDTCGQTDLKKFPAWPVGMCRHAGS